MEITRDAIVIWLKDQQDSICGTLENADGAGKFTEDNWIREAGGGGRTRVLENGGVIEKGGVNFSAVHGPAPAFLMRELGLKEAGAEFFATGISIVLHPGNPWVPIIHMNIRYFELGKEVRWLGGGIDLTPHYIVDEDARLFHHTLKTVCDRHHPEYYREYKKWADDYFYLPHRGEHRGIGGIFFDKIGKGDNAADFAAKLEFWKDIGRAFAPLYAELMNRNRQKSFGEKEKQWQLVRRARYVEFNLVYDRGTRFGLETGGRIESILMSLPPLAAWPYSEKQAGNSSAETRTTQILKNPENWVA